MTQKKTYTITCPKCEYAQDVELYESVNVTATPGLRDALMNNRLNSVECKECAFLFRVDKPLLYHDAGNHFMIYWIPLHDKHIEEGQRQFRDSMGTLNGMLPEDMEAPSMHLVFSRIELVERIFLLEEGLDERLIEYAKYMIYTQNIEKVDPHKKALLFNAQDSTPEHLCFVIQNLETLQLEGMLQYSRQAYDGLCEMFDQDEQTPNLLEIYPGPYISARALLIDDTD